MSARMICPSSFFGGKTKLLEVPADHDELGILLLFSHECQQDHGLTVEPSLVLKTCLGLLGQLKISGGRLLECRQLRRPIHPRRTVLTLPL